MAELVSQRISALSIQHGNWYTPRPHRRRLDQLPGEVRTLIYSFALVEASLWDRDHERSCWSAHTPKCGHMLPPPFSRGQITLDTRSKPCSLKSNRSCKCSKRKGISLLSTCRAIHEEASPIFWSQNTFCFLSSAECCVAVRNMMRRKHVIYLRSISVMNWQNKLFPRELYTQFGGVDTTKMNAFWHAIFLCTKLTDLELSPIYFKDAQEFLAQLPEKNPNLMKIRCGLLLTQRIHRPHNAPRCTATVMDNLVYCRASRSVSLHPVRDAEATLELWRDLSYNFAVHVTSAILDQCMNLVSEFQWPSLPVSISASSRSRQVVLPTGRPITVTFYGMPPSRKPYLTEAKANWLEHLEHFEKTGQTKSQTAAMKQAAATRKQKRQDELEEERSKYTEELSKRQERQKELETEERQVDRDHRAWLQEAEKLRLEDRKTERRRSGQITIDHSSDYDNP